MAAEDSMARGTHDWRTYRRLLAYVRPYWPLFIVALAGYAMGGAAEAYFVRLFGELVVMLPPNANRLHINPLVVALREQMKDFGPDDYVIAVGDPSLIAAAACIATKKTGGLLRILKWDRQSSSYIPVEANV